MNTKTITSFQEIQLETLSKINGGAKDEFSKMMYNTGKGIRNGIIDAGKFADKTIKKGKRMVCGRVDFC
ncbi:ComC/BlpC family leader-containing pheromone/bacteriocin [Streptococcus pluranimalium]|uniref:ComC/BlpC family leader-containing pheromone/bacteriocin n=1 Tax=Streptococcus pluranimalium TaxID=82348 RepID=UPI0024151C6F|nr:ComC/BlpC family leader-containing pheromone/bacteriocin [Streptococcus pluranimalium]WFM79287.1 hypothetical protein P7F70_07050 [Streptococcus pluranimalium]HEM6117097.1 ComC/BlpC family leader-containing pheromone/bacteriocin [Streptococcus suis]HEM6117512.1 ComC/BlpC family leader-containing pheromone/bacteriocin [Streptococcus suis]